MKNLLLLYTICGLLMLLFLYAGLDKLYGLKQFRHDMANQPIPRGMVPFLAVGIPISEVATAVMVVPDRTRKWGLYLSLGLLSVFSIYVLLVVLYFFPKVPCSCGELIERLSWPQHLAFNLFFTGLSITGIILDKNIHMAGAARRVAQG